jgi:uncharacterized membrane protein YkvA (DUF1232 family)
MKNYKKKLRIIDKGYLKRKSRDMGWEDIEKVLEKLEEIFDKVADSEHLKSFLDDVQTMASMLKDYYRGVYREVPFSTICAIAFALLYVFWPLDLIPDILPVIGYLDDAAVICVCLKLVKHDLEKYRRWKAGSRALAA